MWEKLKKYVQEKRPRNLTPLQQFSQKELTKIATAYYVKHVEDYPKQLTKVKQFNCYDKYI